MMYAQQTMDDSNTRSSPTFTLLRTENSKYSKKAFHHEEEMQWEKENACRLNVKKKWNHFGVDLHSGN